MNRVGGWLYGTTETSSEMSQATTEMPQRATTKTVHPAKEEVLGMIATGVRQARSGEGLRPAREVLKEVREELQSEMAADVIDPS